MKKTLFILISLVVFSLGSEAFASRTEFSTDQVCGIEGTIQSLEFKDAFRDPCVKDHSCPVGAYNPEQEAMYYLRIKIDAVSCKPDKKDDPSAYEHQFQVNSEMDIYVNQSIIRNGDVLRVGQRIKGDVMYSFGHQLTSYVVETSIGNEINNDIDEQQEVMKDDWKGNSFLYVLSPVIIFVGLIMGIIWKRRKMY